MPEPATDKFRESPELTTGLKKPAYPIRNFLYATEDESYQFRVQNTAYENGSAPHDLPDGLQTDGTQPRHWGDVPTAHEDNETDIRHNVSKAKKNEY